MLNILYVHFGRNRGGVLTRGVFCLCSLAAMVGSGRYRRVVPLGRSLIPAGIQLLSDCVVALLASMAFNRLVRAGIRTLCDCVVAWWAGYVVDGPVSISTESRYDCVVARRAGCVAGWFWIC